MRGDMQVRFGGRYGKTYCRKAVRRSVPSLRLGKGGGIIELAAHLYATDHVPYLLERIAEQTPHVHPVSFSFGKQDSFGPSFQQLEFLSGKSGILPLRPLQERKKIPRVSGFEDVKVTELSHEALKGYLKERGIDPAIAGRFCKEVAYGIRGKRYFAIGFMNRSGGYELRNPMFKGCISPKDISCVSLSGKKQDRCCVFEGFMDFLSALVLRTVKDEDCLVLNSVSNLGRSYAVLEVYGKIRCFLDRDRAGITALETLTIHFGNKVTDCSGLYDGFKDLNEYLTKTKENK